MKTILFYIWVFRSYFLLKRVGVPLSWKEVRALCEEESWMLDIALKSKADRDLTEETILKDLVDDYTSEA